jgi:hypothetical protein
MKSSSPYVIILALAAILAASLPIAAGKTMSRVKELTALQKMARKRLKLQEKAWKRSFHGRRIPRAQWLAAKRQYEGYMRELRTQQKAEKEQLKNQLKLQRAASKSGL